MVVVRLLGRFNPQILKPLRELVSQFDRMYVCLCDNCRNHVQTFPPFPCMFRKNWAWKSCKNHQPIARNSFLAARVRYLTRWLSLDEAIGLFRRELGDIYEPIKGRRQHK